MVQLSKGDKDYPTMLAERLGSYAPGRLLALGDVRLLKLPILGILSSRQIDGGVLLDAREILRSLHGEDIVVAGGWHSPMEKESLQVGIDLGYGVIYVNARSLKGIRIQRGLVKPLEEGRALLVSPDLATRRVSRLMAERRNRLVAALSRALLVLLAPEGSSTAALARQVIGWGLTVCALEHPANAHLHAAGALPATARSVRRALLRG